MTETHQGQCFCGAVEIEASGTPAGMGYCHCESCRHWSAGPVNAFTLWPPDAVRVTKGEAHLASYSNTPNSDRAWCRQCGGHVLTRHSPLGLVDIYAALLPTLTFAPELHVNYAEAVLRIPDGLPKMKDFPAEFGGSGETVPE